MLKCCYITANFCIHASKGPVIIMNQINSIYNGPFKDSHSRPIHTGLKGATGETGPTGQSGEPGRPAPPAPPVCLPPYEPVCQLRGQRSEAARNYIFHILKYLLSPFITS